MFEAGNRLLLALLISLCPACAEQPLGPGPGDPARVVVVQSSPPHPLTAFDRAPDSPADTPPPLWRAGDPVPEQWLRPELAGDRAPDLFAVAFDTTKGEFVVRVERAWAPLGVDRFFHLVRIGYYTDIAVFRAIKGFMVQFGIHGVPRVSAAWKDAHIADDPVTTSNTRGTLVFAMAGPGTRTVQLFVNTSDNSRLDGMRFAPFGKVIEGMDVVDSLYAGYGEGRPGGQGPGQAELQTRGNEYVRSEFPELDFIRSARVVSVR